MEDFNRKKHWETIYQTKELNQVSWYQPTPETALNFIEELKTPKDAQIIDIGGGDSFLVDHLLDLGYSNLTVLDISEAAIQRAQKRLGNKANRVNWIVSDVVDFQPTQTYDLWYDRAAFHFLTEEQDVLTYVKTAVKSLNPGGNLIVGTFSEQGPKKCSGIEIRQYTKDSLTQTFAPYFDRLSCSCLDHKTPFDTTQNFVFCSFLKRY